MLADTLLIVAAYGMQALMVLVPAVITVKAIEVLS